MLATTKRSSEPSAVQLWTTFARAKPPTRSRTDVPGTQNAPGKSPTPLAVPAAAAGATGVPDSTRPARASRVLASSGDGVLGAAAGTDAVLASASVAVASALGLASS